MNWIFLSVALVCASAIELEDIANVRKGSEEGADIGGHRKPKLFFVSSASTTTTILTDIACYVSTSANPAIPITTCKRKRSILTEGVDHLPDFQPSQVESGLDDTASEERQGKFLLYWLTTTSTSTTSSFTKTLTIASVICTPSGASFCG